MFCVFVNCCFQSPHACDSKQWKCYLGDSHQSIKGNLHTHAHFPCSILPFFSVNSRVVITTAEGDGRGIKVRNRHWHGRMRSGLWLVSAACFHPRGFFQRVDSLPYTRWLQRTSRPICVTNLLNKERRMLHQAKFEDNRRPLRSSEDFISVLTAWATCSLLAVETGCTHIFYLSKSSISALSKYSVQYIQD